jgi:hypothetical protein
MTEYYNIQVLRGLSSNLSLLSCQQSTPVVDLWYEDDASGRQRWVLNPIEGSPGVFTIAVAGGTGAGYSFLGYDPASNHVLLCAGDDGSGNQRWQLIPVDSREQVLEIPSYYLLQPQNGAKTYMSVPADGSYVDLWPDDGSGRQRWQLQGPGYQP